MPGKDRAQKDREMAANLRNSPLHKPSAVKARKERQFRAFVRELTHGVNDGSTWNLKTRDGSESA